jgi:hypothetical protein
MATGSRVFVPQDALEPVFSSSGIANLSRSGFT